MGGDEDYPWVSSLLSAPYQSQPEPVRRIKYEPNADGGQMYQIHGYNMKQAPFILGSESKLYTVQRDGKFVDTDCFSTKRFIWEVSKCLNPERCKVKRKAYLDQDKKEAKRRKTKSDTKKGCRCMSSS